MSPDSWMVGAMIRLQKTIIAEIITIPVSSIILSRSLEVNFMLGREEDAE